MVGFYVGTGMVVVLFVGGWFAWTPLRVWYWERETVKTMADYRGPGPLGGFCKSPRAPLELATLGPAAYGAFDRLLENPEQGVRLACVAALFDARPRWDYPLLIKASQDRDVEVAVRAISVVQLRTNEEFFPKRLGNGWVTGYYIVSVVAGNEKWRTMSQEEVGPIREALLAWWDREGKAKYGRGGE
jgi:hypothetical protein